MSGYATDLILNVGAPPFLDPPMLCDIMRLMNIDVASDADLLPWQPLSVHLLLILSLRVVVSAVAVQRSLVCMG